MNKPTAILPILERRGREAIAARFWDKVDVRGPGECWNWTSTTSRGRGQLTVGKAQMVSAPRLAWALTRGEPGPSICHACDNPLCVNPAHLFSGDQAANVQDMHAKGRARKARGEGHGHAKLTEAQVVEIFHSREPACDTAARFGISDTTVCWIKNGKAWGWLTSSFRGATA